MSYDILTRPTNWWRVAAIILGCAAVFAGIVINRDRAASRDLTAAIDRLEGKVLLARSESVEIRESLGRAEAHIAESQRIGNELADIIGALADGDSEIDQLIREIVEQVRSDLSGDPGSGAGGAGSGP